jgi:hypothetical protein
MPGSDIMRNFPIPAGRLVASAVALACLLALPLRAETPRGPSAPLGERDITITNRSDRPINEIYISPTAAETWGVDRLDEATIAPGGTTRIRLGRTRDCSFDVQIIYDDATREDRIGLDVCRNHQLSVDGRAATPLPGLFGTTHLVTLQNRSPRPIRQVFISPAYAEQWGDDMLSQQLAEGDSVQLPYRGDCAADLRVVFANRAAEERRGLDLCATPALIIVPGWTTADPVPTAELPGKHSEAEDTGHATVVP